MKILHWAIVAFSIAKIPALILHLNSWLKLAQRCYNFNPVNKYAYSTFLQKEVKSNIFVESFEDNKD